MAEYDYVIVGAGAAGCVLAARLSEDPSVSVLLLEAGGPDSNPLIRIPLGVGRLRGRPAYDWCYRTAPEPHLDHRTIPLPLGRVVGGSSAINGMVYVRGHPADFEDWHRRGNAGWAWQDVEPYFRRAEAHERMGGTGPLHISVARAKHPLYRAFVEAGQAAGYPIADGGFNAGGPDGFGWFDFNIRNGRRWTASAAYLRPALRRPNLTLAPRAQVDRVLVERGRAVGASWRTPSGLQQARAGREVIVSAGAIGSPSLLLRSGIGDPDALRPLGIAPVVPLPGVGRNLQNHPDIAVRHLCPAPVTLHSLLRADRIAAAMAQAWLFGSGPAAGFPGESGGFIRSKDDAERPDLECHLVSALRIANVRFGNPFARARSPLDRDGFSVRIMLLRPQSRGHVRLASADPAVPPLICHNYLAEPEEVRALLSGVRQMRRVLTQPAFDRWRGAELEPGDALQGGDELIRWIRTSLDTQGHPVGTCRMGSDDEAVVDPALRLRGVEALRVVDASVMPTIPSANTFATTVMIAEKAADLIRGGAS